MRLRLSLAVCALALLLGGCRQATDRPPPVPPQGLYILATAEARLGAATAGEATVSYAVHLYNGGTVPCESLSNGILFQWPASVENRIVGGSSTAPFGRVSPGEQVVYYGEWTIDMRGLDPGELAATTISIQCRSPVGPKVAITPSWRRVQ